MIVKIMISQLHNIVYKIMRLPLFKSLIIRVSVFVVVLHLCQDIDDYICQAKDKSYDTLVHFGRKGLNVAATAAVMAATKVLLTLNI